MTSWIFVRVALATGVAFLLIGCGSSGGSSRGSDLLFVSSRQGAYAIYLMTASGSRQRRLTRGAVGASSSPGRLFFQVDPAWSPDGRSIAFASSRDGSSHIFVMKANGSGTSRLHGTSGVSEQRRGLHCQSMMVGPQGYLLTPGVHTEEEKSRHDS